MQELKTCLREYRLPLRVINGRNMMPKATFGQTGWHWFGDIRQICVHLSTTHPMTWFVWQLLVLLAMNSVSAKADRTHVYFMDVKRCNGIRLCACGCFGQMLRLKVWVHGGVFVATKSQIVSRESGMPFEPVWTQFALIILLWANLDNDPSGCTRNKKKTPSRLPIWAWKYVVAMFDHHQFNQ